MKKFGLFAAAGAVALASTATAPTPAKAQATPYIGQMMLFGGTFCPRGWTPANGQLLSISQYSSVFSLLGVMYGGDGRSTFAVPDLRGRAPISAGNGPGLPDYRQGTKGGSTSFTLTIANMPAHSHTGTMRANRAAGNSANPAGNVLAISPDADKIYHLDDSTVNMAPSSLVINNTGGNQPVNKVSPYLAMQWCVALQGVFPSRS